MKLQLLIVLLLINLTQQEALNPIYIGEDTTNTLYEYQKAKTTVDACLNACKVNGVTPSDNQICAFECSAQPSPLDIFKFQKYDECEASCEAELQGSDLRSTLWKNTQAQFTKCYTGEDVSVTDPGNYSAQGVIAQSQNQDAECIKYWDSYNNIADFEMTQVFYKFVDVAELQLKCLQNCKPQSLPGILQQYKACTDGCATRNVVKRPYYGSTDQSQIIFASFQALFLILLIFLI